MRLLVLTLVLAGCFSPPRVLEDPASHATVDCGSRSEWTNWWGVANVNKERECIAAYQRDGWRLSR
jgi:hypothetical protein